MLSVTDAANSEYFLRLKNECASSSENLDAILTRFIIDNVPNISDEGAEKAIRIIVNQAKYVEAAVSDPKTAEESAKKFEEIYLSCTNTSSRLQSLIVINYLQTNLSDDALNKAIQLRAFEDPQILEEFAESIIPKNLIDDEDKCEYLYNRISSNGVLNRVMNLVAGTEESEEKFHRIVHEILPDDELEKEVTEIMSKTLMNAEDRCIRSAISLTEKMNEDTDADSLPQEKNDEKLISFANIISSILSVEHLAQCCENASTSSEDNERLRLIILFIASGIIATVLTCCLIMPFLTATIPFMSTLAMESIVVLGELITIPNIFIITAILNKIVSCISDHKNNLLQEPNKRIRLAN